MKLAYRDFSEVMETSHQMVMGTVIENQNMLYQFLIDLKEAMEGKTEKVVLSCDNVIIDFAKNTELLTDFIQFDLNKRELLSKIVTAIDKISTGDRFYNSSQQLLMQIENQMMDMTMDFPCNLTYDKLNMQSIIKATGISVEDNYTCLAEKLLAYMELARDFLNKKLFILVNIRGLISSQELQRLVDAALLREHEIILVDYMDYPRLKQERRLLIDKDLCEI